MWLVSGSLGLQGLHQIIHDHPGKYLGDWNHMIICYSTIKLKDTLFKKCIHSPLVLHLFAEEALKVPLQWCVGSYIPCQAGHNWLICHEGSFSHAHCTWWNLRLWFFDGYVGVWLFLKSLGIFWGEANTSPQPPAPGVVMGGHDEFHNSIASNIFLNPYKYLKKFAWS